MAPALGSGEPPPASRAHPLSTAKRLLSKVSEGASGSSSWGSAQSSVWQSTHRSRARDALPLWNSLGTDLRSVNPGEWQPHRHAPTHGAVIQSRATPLIEQ